MSRDKKELNPKFKEYMYSIISNPIYEGLPIEEKGNGEYRWVTTKKSDIGKRRIAWCEKKADELGIKKEPGFYADVMLQIHPTKMKVCQTCGKSMSLYYVYPNLNLVKKLNRKYKKQYTNCDDIRNIWDDLIHDGISKSELVNFLKNEFRVEIDEHLSKDEIINKLEILCRKNGCKLMGPGAMSNFPDRFDGFHSYNRCCRSSEDKGRSKENLKSYTKDRRAYEYWSDGNIHAADEFMGSSYFYGASADHVGPISLGFVHDPRYLQKMGISDNSSKNNKLQKVDIEKIIDIENRTKIYPMSWYSKLIWEYIKKNYKQNTLKISTDYKNALLQNTANYMYVLYKIINTCNSKGEYFLTKAFLEPNYRDFQYTYKFDENGNIIEKYDRHFTERSDAELSRYKRVAIDSVKDYNNKQNRNISENLTDTENRQLNNLCTSIMSGGSIEINKKKLEDLMMTIQNRIIRQL